MSEQEEFLITKIDVEHFLNFAEHFKKVTNISEDDLAFVKTLLTKEITKEDTERFKKINFDLLKSQEGMFSDEMWDSARDGIERLEDLEDYSDEEFAKDFVEVVKDNG